MHLCGMYLKVVRMFGAGFETSGGDLVFRIKIMCLRYFCALDYTTKMLNCKMDEIANVCGAKESFSHVMYVDVPGDNMIPILLIC